LLYPKIRAYLPEKIQIVSQSDPVGLSLRDYLHRHPRWGGTVHESGHCDYFTTECEKKFTGSASVFLNEPISGVRHVELEGYAHE
jgi:glutamate racemase